MEYSIRHEEVVIKKNYSRDLGPGIGDRETEIEDRETGIEIRDRGRRG
jgi:hypothetical protein